MKKSWLRLLAALLCFALLTGCSASLFNPETALKAPGATDLYQGVQEALEAAVGENIILKYPLVGDTNTAFCPRDLDGDGTQEMLAFYQQQAEGAVTRVNVIRNVSGEWYSVQDMDPLGSDIANVDFCDFNGDGAQEVLIGWSIYTTSSNQMCIYQMENGLLVQRAAEAYTRHVICDIDGDSAQELGLALLDTEKNTSSISFYKMGKDDFSMIGTLGLDGSVVSYGKMSAAGITSKNVGVYLDAYKSTDSTITELIYFKGGKLYNPFASSKDASNIATLRYCSLTSSDMNADGVVEIPFSERLPGYGPEDAVATHHVVCWRYFNGNISDTVSTWWYNAQEGYYLELDSSWQGNITVLYDEAQREYVFFHWDGKAIGKRLFSIKTFPVSDWDSRQNTAYTQLYSNSVSVWAVSVEAENPLSVNYEKINRNFHLILK